MAGRELTAVVAVALVLLSYSLVVPASGDANPVAFDDTFELGLTRTTLQTVDDRGLSVPRVEAFYSGYEYVVGYNTLEAFVTEHARTGHERQFGHPVALFVSDYANANVSLAADGSLRASRYVGFVPASEAFVVVGSRARLPSGPVAVPFGERSAAAAFADEYGGRVVPWAAVQNAVEPSAALSRERFEGMVANRSAWANDTAASARTLRDRPTSVVVGEDEPTLAAAVDAAPPNTTVAVPAGTYRVSNLTVDKPVTVRGAGPDTRIVGNDNGTVVRVTAERVGLADLSIAGVGGVGSRGAGQDEDVPGSWSKRVELAYARGDAAAKFFDADGSLVSNVRVDTSASGVVTVGSRGLVVDGLAVNGAADPMDGFMGVVAMYDPVVVQDSTFRGGRDGVYTHRADGIVVRDSEFRDARFGVHLMYTSGALLRDNVARDESIGVVVMTRPTENLVVGNDVRGSTVGVSSAGSESYYAENVVAGNQGGMDVSGYRSLFTHNTVVGNDVGLTGDSAIPTNLVTANDVVDNGEPATSDLGPLRVWTVDDAGNYWGALPGGDRDGDGHYDRTFKATGALDPHVDDAVGVYTLAESPAVELVRQVQGTVPGLREGGIVDVAPRVRPARPDVLADVRANATEVSA